jgi:urease accessory protein UreF
LLKHRWWCAVNHQAAVAAALVEAWCEGELAEASHCKDCCCARSWAALGITDYTGKSIPEQIADLRAKLAEAKKAYRMLWEEKVDIQSQVEARILEAQAERDAIAVEIALNDVAEVTGAQVGDEVKVELEGDEIRYFKNGELIATKPIAKAAFL